MSDLLTQPADPIALFVAPLASSGLRYVVTGAFAPPEYVIVRKREYLRDGGSDKHRSDTRAMLARSGANMNLGLLSDLVRQRGLDELWTRVRR